MQTNKASSGYTQSSQTLGQVLYLPKVRNLGKVTRKVKRGRPGVCRTREVKLWWLRVLRNCPLPPAPAVLTGRPDVRHSRSFGGVGKVPLLAWAGDLWLRDRPSRRTLFLGNGTQVRSRLFGATQAKGYSIHKSPRPRARVRHRLPWLRRQVPFFLPFGLSTSPTQPQFEAMRASRPPPRSSRQLVAMPGSVRYPLISQYCQT